MICCAKTHKTFNIKQKHLLLSEPGSKVKYIYFPPNLCDVRIYCQLRFNDSAKLMLLILWRK